MLFRPPSTAARAAPSALSVHGLAMGRWMLLAWLSVLLVGGITPWVQAGQGAENKASGPPPWGWERACSASGETRWIPSPVAQQLGVQASQAPYPPYSPYPPQAQTGPAGAAHWLDCPLCLPLLAPPPLALSSGRAQAATTPWLARRYVQPEVQASAVLPPTRAPPWVYQIS